MPHYWTHAQEQLLFDTIVQSTGKDTKIQWKIVQTKFPELTYNILYAKYYRMKHNPVLWNFKKAIKEKVQYMKQCTKQDDLAGIIGILDIMQ